MPPRIWRIFIVRCPALQSDEAKKAHWANHIAHDSMSGRNGGAHFGYLAGLVQRYGKDGWAVGGHIRWVGRCLEWSDLVVRWDTHAALPIPCNRCWLLMHPPHPRLPPVWPCASCAALRTCCCLTLWTCTPASMARSSGPPGPPWRRCTTSEAFAFALVFGPASNVME